MKYLGTIDNAGSDVKNNATATTPFTIPDGFAAIVVQPSTATFMVAISTVAAGFLPAATDMLQLGGANSIQSIPTGGLAITVASRKTDAGAGTLKVFGVRSA